MITQEAFNNMVYDYYLQNSDFDICDINDIVSLIANFSERCSRFIVDLIDGNVGGEEAGYYCLTPKGLEYYENMMRQKILRHDDLQEKYLNFTITIEEFVELQELKKELVNV